MTTDRPFDVGLSTSGEIDQVIVRAREEDEPATAQAQSRVRAPAASIAVIEHGLLHDDPKFVRRMLRLHRAGIATAIAVFALLVSSALLLAVGLATRSHLAWFGGGLTFVAAFAIDRGYQRALRR